MKCLNLLPIDDWHLGERVEELKLRCRGCSDDPCIAALRDSPTDRCGSLLRRCVAQGSFVVEHFDPHEDISGSKHLSSQNSKLYTGGNQSRTDSKATFVP